MSDRAIDTLLHEDRRFPPPEGFSARAVVRDPAIYEAGKDLEAFWDAQARGFAWERPWTQVLDWAAAVRQVVRGGAPQHHGQLPRPPRAGRQRRQGGLALGGGAGGHAHADLRRAARGGLPHRQCPPLAGGEEGRSRHALHGHDPRAGHRRARLRAHRRPALSRLRGLQPGRAPRAHRGLRLEGAHHRRRRVAEGQRRPAQGQRGRRRRGRLARGDRARRTPHRRGRSGDRRAAHDRWARRVVARRRARAGLDLRARDHGRRGPALHPLHQRHHGQAEGDRPHHGRLPRRHGDDAPLGLRHPRGRRVLVHRRHRVDHRAQLHRVWAARQRLHGRDVRGGAQPPGQRPAVVAGRQVRCDDLLHGAHGHPDLHALGHGAAGAPRPLVVAAARHRGRADQPRGVDVVPRQSRRRRCAARSWTPGGRPRPARS